MWKNTGFDFEDKDGSSLNIKINYGFTGIVLESKEGVYFATESDFVSFVDELKEKALTLFE